MFYVELEYDRSIFKFMFCLWWIFTWNFINMNLKNLKTLDFFIWTKNWNLTWHTLDYKTTLPLNSSCLPKHWREPSCQPKSWMPAGAVPCQTSSQPRSWRPAGGSCRLSCPPMSWSLPVSPSSQVVWTKRNNLNISKFQWKISKFCPHFYIFKT